MATLAASAYFLTCCRPANKSRFCFYVEPTKFIDLNYYLKRTPIQAEVAVCDFHEKLSDHSLNVHSSCTDERAWSQDSGQRRRHFLDITNKHIPLCGTGIHEGDNRNLNENQAAQNSTETTVPAKKPKEKKVEEKPYIEKKIEEAATPVNLNQEEKEKDSPAPTSYHLAFEDIDLTPTKEVPENPQRRPEAPDTFSDDIIEKLDCNLVNLEETFDKFVKKNRDFIQNLVKCLAFEKRKQKELEKSYEILKQENDALRIKTEYQKMVNTKQLELFKNELDKGLTETKNVYNAKIKQLENQLCLEQEELKYYKKCEKKFLEALDNETNQVKCLKDKIKLQRAREIEILKNFTNVLNFLEDVKNSVNISDLGNEALLKTSGIIGDNENTSIREVLSSALNCGMESLNVRDLSILHDAIQELNERLCHQNEICGRNPMTNVSLCHLSMNYAIGFECCSDPDCRCKINQDYTIASCLSLFPTRQEPEKKIRFK